MAWTDLDLAAPGSVAPGGGVAAIAKDPRSSDTFWIGADGSVQVASYEPGTAWVKSTLAGPGSASLSGGLTAISKQFGRREVWWIGADGSVQAAYYEGIWNLYTLAGPGSAAVTGGITGVSKGGDLMEVWWIGADGSVQAAYHEGIWNLYTLAGPGSAAVTGGITGVSKGGDLMEVWWIGADGSVQAAYHEPIWNLYTLAGPGSAAVTGGIIGVSKGGDLMEVWWIGADGSVQAAYHEPIWNLYTLAGPGSAAVTGGITGVSKGGGSMEVWWIGADGSVQAASHEPIWNLYTLAGPGSAAPTSRIGAAFRTSASMGTFWASGQASLREAFTVPVAFEGPIKTDSELGGSVALYLHEDGSIRWQGHGRAHGWAGYHYGVSAFVAGPLGLPPLLAAHTGDVHGTLSPGSRDDYWDDWDETHPNPILANHLGDYRFGTLALNTDYSNTTTGFLLSALDWILELRVAHAITATGGIGLIIAVGFEVGSLIVSGSPVPGARIIGNNMWLAGFDGMLFAIALDTGARLGNHARGLTHEEYKWANDQVYKGALPPMDSLLLTNTIGAGGRPFTFKRWDGQITLNLGDAGYANPTLLTNRAYPFPGEVFIHELLHACQIQHSQNLGFTLPAILSHGNPDDYKYGNAGGDYTGFKLEAQAQIVSDWFAGHKRPGTNQTTTPMDEGSPYFRYIRENVRVGKL